MGRRLVPVATLGVLIGVIALFGAIRSGSDLGAAAPLAQQGSPFASPVPDAIEDAVEDLPADVNVALLASAEQTGMPPNGLVLRLERITFLPGELISEQSTGTELIVVDSGSATYESGGRASVLEPGGQQHVVADTSYMLSAGKSGAVVLRLELGTREEASPVAQAQGSPVAGPVPVLLFEGNVDRLVSRRGTLFLARVTLAPGATTGEQVFSGPVGVVIEDGSADISSEQTVALTLDEGHSGFLPGFTAFTASNVGDDAAVLLAGGLLAPPRGGAEGPTTTPTPEVDQLATSQALAEDLSSNVATLTQQGIDLENTVVAQQTAIAGAESDLATAEAELTAVAVSAQVGAATAESDLEQTRAELSVAQTRVAEEEAARATVEASLTSVSSQLATAQAAATTAAEQATEAADLSAQQVGSLESTVVALQTGVAEGAAGQSAAEASVVALQTESSGQSAEIESANATIVGQATAQANLEGEQAAAATAASQAQADAAATANAQSSAIAAGNAAATAQAATAAANLAAAQGTSQANATALAQSQAAAAASSTAQAGAATAAAATASATAASADATVAAQQAEITGLEASLEGSAGELADANATIVALNTAVAESEGVAGASVDPSFVDLSIQVDLNQVLAGDETAIEAARSALAGALQPYEGCRAAIVLTFGHGNTIGQGTQLAAAINTIIQAEETKIFGGAAFDAFGDLTPPLGQVDLRIYFFTGCEPPPVEAVTPTG